MRSFVRVSGVVVGIVAMVFAASAPAQASSGEVRGKKEYQQVKQGLLSVAEGLEDTARADLVENGSPADETAFFDRVITEYLGAASPPAPVDLPDKCATAVQPVRNAMGKYSSLFVMPAKEVSRLVNHRLVKAREGCGPDSVAWAHFYVEEFEPWYLSTRANYEFERVSNGFKIRPMSWRKYREYGPLCQKLSFDSNGWLVRSSCRK